MNTTLLSALDARQTPEWGEYLTGIGWKYKKIDNTFVFIRPLNFLPLSVIKIQHPIGPLPFSKIDDLARQNKALLAVIEPHIYNYDEQAFMQNGYTKSVLRYAHTATIKMDVKSTETELFKKFSENAKRNIKKSQNYNLHVKSIFYKNEKTEKEFKAFYNLLVNLRTMKKFKTPDYNEYLKKITAFKKSSVLLFAYEKNNPDPIAAVWYVYFNNVISYFQTGITDKGYDVLANYLLVWEGLKLAKKLKLDVFDFETIYDPRYPTDHTGWKGYTVFKKKFHGTEIEYPPSWIKLYNPVFKAFYLCTSIFMK